MKTGLFVSPHISSFRERIQINNQLISPEDFVVLVPHSSLSLTDRQRHLERILLLCESHSIPATQFEITFLMSCLQYESAQCDVVVLEVSLCLSPVSPSSLLICPSPCPVGGLWWRMGCNKCHPIISLHYLLCWSVHLLFRLISVPQG
jgi:hypothetical protein